MNKRRTNGNQQEPDIDREIAFIYRRASLLRRGTILLSISTVCSSILIALSVAHSFVGFRYDRMMAIGLIVLASIFFAMEIWISLHALRLVVRRLPPSKNARWRV